MLKLVQPGSGPDRDLFIWLHPDIRAELRAARPEAAVLHYFAFDDHPPRPLLSFRTLAQLAAQHAEYAGRFRKTVAGVFGAAGRHLEAKLRIDSKLDASVLDPPDTLLLVNALHIRKSFAQLAPSDTDLSNLLAAAAEAATNGTKHQLIIWYSDFALDGHFKQKHIADLLATKIEELTKRPLDRVDLPEPLSHGLTNVRQRDGFVLLESKYSYSEDFWPVIRLTDEILCRLVPWFTQAEAASPGDYLYLPAATPLPPPAPAITVDEALPLAVLAEAEAALAAGVKEDGHNTGALLKPYFDEFGVKPPANWCGVTTGSWIRWAAKKLGVEPPVSGSPGAKATMYQLQKAGRWTPAALVTRKHLRPGTVAVWHRGKPGAWTGHIGVVRSGGEGTAFVTIEGNSGPHTDQVARMNRTTDDPDFLGIGYLGQLPARPAVS